MTFEFIGRRRPSTATNGYASTSSRFRRFFDPIAHILIAVIAIPPVERIALRKLATSFRRVALEVLYLADINAKKTVTNCNALFDLVLYPATTACVLTNEYDRNRSAIELRINPPLNCTITLPFYLFKVGGVNKASCLCTLGNPTISNDHCA